MWKRTRLILSANLCGAALGIFAEAQQTTGVRSAHTSSSRSASSSTSRTTSSAAVNGTREQDGLLGLVRRVRTETAKLSTQPGKAAQGEEPRVLLESVTYDLRGNRTENAYYTTANAAAAGKEVYRYDDRGNTSEKILYREDGSVLNQEFYTYEFDAVGNWIKMTTLTAVDKNGKVGFEPTEVTYRIIDYHSDQSGSSSTTGIAQPRSPVTSSSTSSTSGAATTTSPPTSPTPPSAAPSSAP